MKRDQMDQVGLMAYILFGVAAVFAPSAVAGLIYAYVKRPEVAGTFVESHMTWLIRTFWWTVILSVIGGILAILLIGFVILFAVGVWYIFRVVKGFMIFYEQRPIADPESLF